MNGTNNKFTFKTEITELAEGTGTRDILRNYLEDYCLNRVKKMILKILKMVDLH